MAETIVKIQELLVKGGLVWSINYVPENKTYVIAVREAE